MLHCSLFILVCVCVYGAKTRSPPKDAREMQHISVVLNWTATDSILCCFVLVLSRMMCMRARRRCVYTSNTPYFLLFPVGATRQMLTFRTRSIACRLVARLSLARVTQTDAAVRRRIHRPHLFHSERIA